MNAINDYKSMIDEVSRALYVFSFSTETNSLTVKDALKSWTDEIISNFANRVMSYAPALRIKNEILDGTPDNSTILRRIELIDYELSMKPLWQPQYQWQWNTELFSLPYAERNDKGEIIKDDNGQNVLTGPGKPIFDILVSINNEKWAWMIMQQLERLATALNFTVKSVEDMLNSLYVFAGGNDNNNSLQKLPDVLNTSLARSTFAKATEKGWMKKTENGYYWCGIKEVRGRIAQLAYMCGKIYGYRKSVSGNIGIEFPNDELCKLFNETKIYNQLVQVYAAQKPQKWRATIDELFE